MEITRVCFKSELMPFIDLIDTAIGLKIPIIIKGKDNKFNLYKSIKEQGGIVFDYEDEISKKIKNENKCYVTIALDKLLLDLKPINYKVMLKNRRGKNE